MSKVIYIPGLPATILRKSQGDKSKKIFPPHLFKLLTGTISPDLKDDLKGPDDLTAPDKIFAGKPIPSTKLFGFDLLKHAQSLYDLLEKAGLNEGEIVPFGWDWRRPVWDLPMLARLREKIHHLAGPNPADKVTLIVHSTGGLLVRHFLKTTDDVTRAKIDRVLAFGVPWGGTLKSLRVMVAQKKFGQVSEADSQEILTSSWASFDLLPRRIAALTMDGQGQGINLLEPQHQGWFHPNYAGKMRQLALASLQNLGEPDNQWEFDQIPLFNVAGWGAETEVKATLQNQQITFNANLPEAQETQGDGTIPFISANWIEGANVTKYCFPIGAYPKPEAWQQKHGTLWRNPGGRQLIHHLFKGAALQPFTYAAVDWGDSGDANAAAVRIRFVLLDTAGAPLPGGHIRVTKTLDHATYQETSDPDGRGSLTMPRTAIPLTGLQYPKRRLSLELNWQGNAKAKKVHIWIKE